MLEDMLETLGAIDPKILTDVVRQDQRSETFEILDWTVKRLSGLGVMNPDGLFLFSGQGRDERGTRSWSVVLKTLKGSDDANDANDANIGNLFYWKREFRLIQSGLTERLPREVAAPRFYTTTEREDGAWIWMEHIVESVNPRWTTDQYVFAARQVGRFSASCLTLNPLPDFPWLCKSHIRDWLAVAAHFQDWDNPYVSKVFSSQLRERVTRLWDESEHFLNTLDWLPQVFSHFDLQRRNIFIRQGVDAGNELVAIDWALVGYGALGTEIVSLIGDNMIVFEVEPAAVPELEAAAFPAYIQGLRDGGWAGDERLVRLASTVRTALYLGAAAPGLISAWTSVNSALAPQLFGHSLDEIASSWASMCEYALDRGDEARQLMDQLHL